MHNDRSLETGLKSVLVPSVVLVVHVVLLENLVGKFRLLLILLIVSVGLLFSSILSLVLQVESDGLLEIALDGTALMLSLKSIAYLNIDLGSVESAITVVESPGSSKFIECLL